VTFRVSLNWLVLALVASTAARPASAQGAGQYFANNCAACHTIGKGNLTGPDLKDVTKRRDRAWLKGFIPAPIKMVESGDPYVLQLQKQYYGIVMPSLPDLTPELVDALLDYIEGESGGGTPGAMQAESQRPVAAAAPPKPFTPAEVDAGRALFMGRPRRSWA
jgi:protein SCO1/2